MAHLWWCPKAAGSRPGGRVDDRDAKSAPDGCYDSGVIAEEKHMGLFDGLLGGVVGAGMVSVVSGILEKHGGVQGVVSEFEKKGLGETVKSWVSTGPNQAISPDEVH